MINGLDIVIIVAFVVIVTVGFFNGIIRLTAMMLSIYIGSVAAGKYYLDLAGVVRRRQTTMSEQAAELICFTVIIFVTTLLLTPLISYLAGRIRFPRRIEIADNIGGAVLGVIAIALAAMPTSILLHALNETVLMTGTGSALGQVHDQIQNSTLVPIFLRMAPSFIRLISPWFPGGLPPILSVVG